MADRLIDTLYQAMPWDALDAVVFDIGGVLVGINGRKALADMFPDDPELCRKVLSHTVRSPYWAMLDRGKLDLDACIGAMTEGDAALEEPIRRFMTGWPDYRTVLEEGRDALLTCKSRGKKVFLLSNFPAVHYERNVREYDFFGAVDGAVISSHVGMLKPEPGIYRYLTETYHLDPARTLFIDDDPGNVEAAMSLGWQGFCMNEPGRLAAFIGETAH